ncbi:MAG: hypothetical protein HQL26_04260 [Candidatus Omnitrophica bacterium]|nr:hypothetical protein [Candidatus Omnitrophota bacterium]
MKKKSLFLLFVVMMSAVAYAAEPALDYNDHNKRDPFWSLVSTSGTILNFDTEYSLSELNIEGIIMGKAGDNMAIIGGKIVKKGELLGQYMVVEIQTDKVILSAGGKISEVKMNKGE